MESKSRMMAYGLMGYQGPLPRATRSLRTRSSAYRKKNVAERNMVPFELLASVAEDLLQQRDLEKQSCKKTTSTTMGTEICREIMAVDENDAEQALLELERSHVPKSSLRSSTNSLLIAKPELDDQASSDENAVAEFAAYRKLQLIQEGPCKDQEEHVEIRCAAMQEKKNGGNSSRKQFCDVEIGEGKGENEIDDANTNAFGCWNKGSSGPRCDDDDMMMMMFLDAHSPPATSGISEETPISAAEAKAPPPLVSSDSSGGAPSSAGNSRQDSFFNCQSTMIDFSKDEDVNSSECNTPTRLCKRPLKTYSKQRKGAAVKQRTTLPPCSKKRIHSEMDSVVNHGFVDRRSSARPVKPTFREGYTYQRGGTRRTPSKRRRISAEETVIPMFDGHTSTASATGVESNAEDGEPMVSVETKSTGHRFPEKYVGAAPSSIASATQYSKDSSNKSDEQHVTVAIKSFTVPELSINMPTSASVASLKRAVMEAAMKLLGDGLRVCVLLQGKKVADESFNLEQLGIQRDGILDSVGFMLEPNPIPTSQTGNDDPLFVLSEAAASQPQSGFPMGPFGHMNSVEPTKTVGKGRSSRANVNAEMAPANKAQTQLSPWTKCENEGDKDAPSQAVGAANPGALILHPSHGATENAAQGLALVPLNSKSREIGKRRIRRPFTVAEVEALVHAVEKLGTGRWRDVKLRAFEHAKHRTYVDLKDKWKTLVHTARIAPHQRRGEPVPQELLDRVIRAHNFWTDQQAKQQAEVCL